MNEELRNAIERLEVLKKVSYQQCVAEYEYIVNHGITDDSRIESLFDRIWNFIDDEDFHALFWRLIGYVEKYDRGLGAYYRRIEEVHFEGY